MGGIAGFLLASPPSAVVTLIVAMLLALAAVEISFHLLRRTRPLTVRSFTWALSRHCWWPARATAVTLVARSMAAGLPAPTWLAPRLEQLLSVLLIACIA